MLRAVFFLLLIPRLTFAEQYLSKDQALSLVFGDACQVEYIPKKISEKLADKLDELGLLSDDYSKAHFFVCSEGSSKKYALIDNEIGKHAPITYIVGIESGKVSSTYIMVYREEIGWEVKDPKFLKQFNNKTIKNDLNIGAGIENITGATMSSKAIAKGVQRALFLYHHFFE